MDLATFKPDRIGGVIRCVAPIVLSRWPRRPFCRPMTRSPTLLGWFGLFVQSFIFSLFLFGGFLHVRRFTPDFLKCIKFLATLLLSKRASRRLVSHLEEKLSGDPKTSTSGSGIGAIAPLVIGTTPPRTQVTIFSSQNDEKVR